MTAWAGLCWRQMARSCTLLAFLVMLAGATATTQERRVALVVGADSYTNLHTLDNAENDARAVAARLSALGFDVEQVLNPTQDQFIAALDRFNQRLRGAAASLLFYSGHAVEVNGADLLLPVDAPYTTSELLLEAKSVNASVILARMLRQAPAAILILDACRDNPLPRDAAKGNAPAVGGARGLVPIDVQVPPDDRARGGGPRGAYVVFAAQPGGVALDRLPGDDHDPNGLFTRYFLRALQQPGQPLSVLMTSVRDEVDEAARRAGREQVPHLDDRMTGSGRFMLGSGTPAQAAPAPPVPDASPPSSPPSKPVPGVTASGYPVAVGESFRDCPDCPEMMVIPAGGFTMGSPDSEPGRDHDEGPRHAVSVSVPLAVGKFAVTFAEWDACFAAGGCGQRPGDEGWGRDRHPVINVSWADAQSYARWLSGRTRRDYRLLTEAEWEYAARAGTTTAYYTGTGITASQAAFNVGHTQPVGSYPPNRFGLSDMAGNVWQWVEDCYVGNYNGAPSDAGQAVTTPGCTARVLRGGSWFFTPRLLRAAYRYGSAAGLRDYGIGFRLARTPGA